MKDGEIKHKLSPAQVSVMLHKVTEPPYFGKYWDHFESGIYRCAACETVLFSSDNKFDSKTGWPSFKKPLNEKDLQFKSEAGPDDKIEIRCKKCKSHLGYVIAGDAPYYRINSVCLVFESLAIPDIALPKIERKDANNAQDVSKQKHMPSDTAQAPGTWSVSSIAAGAVAGVIIGAGATALYLVPAVAPATDQTATTTAEIATTTDEVPSADIAPDTTLQGTPFTPTEPLEVPATRPESAPTETGASTSTQ